MSVKRCTHCGLVRDVGEDVTRCEVDGAPLEAADEAALLVGRTLAERFRLDALLGTGGMGAVYRAQQLSVDRPVAVKVLRGRLGSDPGVVQRFLREAKATSRLRSDHTITVHDFGQADDEVLFLAMELLEGRTLRQRLVTGPLGVEEVLDVLDGVTASLAEAHALGIVHRDIKPANIFLERRADGRSERVKVLDFGVARLVGELGGPALTGPGVVLGSVPYLAPEACAGEAVGPAADVYAVGVMTHELLTCRRPFRGSSIVEVMRAHLETPAPALAPSLAGHPLGAALAEVVARCLVKAPAARPADARALRTLLEPLWDQLARGSGPAAPVMLDTGAAPTRPPRARRRPFPWPWLAAGAVLAAGLGVLAGGLLPAAETPAPDPAPAAAPVVVEDPPPPPAPSELEPAPKPEVAPPPAAEPATTVTVTVRSTPSGAEVLRDGAAAGETPVTLALPAGAPTALELRAAGHAPAIVTTSGSDQALDVDLTPVTAPSPPGKTRAPSRVERGIEVLLDDP